MRNKHFGRKEQFLFGVTFSILLKKNGFCKNDINKKQKLPITKNTNIN
jgi:hypothetical protein